MKHKLGFWLGRKVDAWCVRGYGHGLFRNAFAQGFDYRHEQAGTRHLCGIACPFVSGRLQPLPVPKEQQP
jgi:hypothetical protein